MAEHQHIDIVYNDWKNEVQVRIGWLRAHYANWSPVSRYGSRHFHSEPHGDDSCPFAAGDVLPMESMRICACVGCIAAAPQEGESE